MAPLVNAARATAQRGRDVDAELAAAAARAAASARAELRAGQHVATISRSSTILAALAGAPPITLLCSRSDPGGEGEATAAAARAAGHTATIVDDAELCERVSRGEVSLVLTGSDAILEGGDVINKIGTRALAEAARGVCPFVIAADSWKRWPDSVPPPLEPWFELVPASAITRIVG
jgi:translation initiation factor 2B subunit (eIF-2B alpha/beta/delta family)